MSPAPKILVVDDNRALLAALAEYLADHGFQISTASQGDEALHLLETTPVDLVLLDLVTPGLPGMEVLTQIRQKLTIPVILMTGFAGTSSAIEALRRGAYEFLTKPVAPEVLPALIRNALDHHRLVRLERVQGGAGITGSYGSLVGRSRAMIDVFLAVEDVAPTEIGVLLTGETGTGKNLIAREIHARSPRAKGPFVEVNCAAIPTSLFESEMFGHERGAYTGAEARRVGRFERAAGGTIFLDEVASLSLELQAKLLQVLQDRRYERVGGGATMTADVRVIAASNVDLLELMRKGSFRADLYYRICVIPIAVPALRERREDIPLLLSRFLAEACHAQGKGIPTISDRALREAACHGWPGNVRELANAVERCVLRNRGAMIESLLGPGGPPENEVATAPPAGPTPDRPIQQYREAQMSFQRAYFLELFQRAEGVVQDAARMAGVELRTLQRYARRLQISVREVRKLKQAGEPAALNGVPAPTGRTRS